MGERMGGQTEQDWANWKTGWAQRADPNRVIPAAGTDEYTRQRGLKLSDILDQPGLIGNEPANSTPTSPQTRWGDFTGELSDVATEGAEFDPTTGKWKKRNKVTGDPGLWSGVFDPGPKPVNR
jgi:hypothetical protein